MQLRMVALLVCAGVWLTAPVDAQRAATRPKAAPKTQAKTVTITGCVAQGIDADHYVLADAVRREQPPTSTAAAGKSGSGSVRSDNLAADDRTGPYDLQGAEFKAHLGHLVEVTGTSGATGKPAEASATESPTERKPLPAFNVQSVKMISATCATDGKQ